MSTWRRRRVDGLDTSRDHLADKRDASDPGRPRRRTRGRVLLVLVLVAVVAAAIGGALGLGGTHRVQRGAITTEATTRISRCTLTDADTVDGQLSYGSASALPLQATGTITWLPQPGRIVTEGQPLLRVDDRPVTLLYGTVPQYRELDPPGYTPDGSPASPSAVHATPLSTGPYPTATSDAAAAVTSGKAGGPSGASGAAPAGSSSPSPSAGSSAPSGSPVGSSAPVPPQHGADVAQLRAALKRLGYDGSDAGDVYGSATVDEVKQWQKHLGEEPTGVVGVGDVYYASGPLRIAPAAQVVVGDQMSPTALTSTGQAQVVTAKASVSMSWAKVGGAATVGLSSGGSVSAAIVSAAAAAGDGGGGQSDVALVLHVTDQSALAHAGSVAVSVTHVNQRRTQVLCVPVVALVALAGGGYGLQLADATHPSYVAVLAGMFAEGKVEVSGAGVAAGLSVQMPVGD